jgi:cysteine synthase A
MVRIAEELAQRHGWFLARQFENEANPAWHRNTTGPEILRDFAGRRLDYFVSGWGTGGTITGAGEVLKLARPGLTVVAAEPAVASLLAGKEWQPHRIQGWTPDFVPAVLSRDVVDRIVTVDDVVARDTARRLAREEGLLVGVSAGATVAAALEVAAGAPEGSALLAMLPDTGERYLSTFLFEGVEEGSDDAWLASLG